MFTECLLALPLRSNLYWPDILHLNKLIPKTNGVICHQAEPDKHVNVHYSITYNIKQLYFLLFVDCENKFSFSIHLELKCLLRYHLGNATGQTVLL